ncbi:pyruvate kinase 1, cytosolic [Selaginella moellendorffii]|uniref:pyruvate kinase 1, cytosolic n=1 Tax=Selaginella moellendorffii TaxID=88036 RepID=UPI000D1CEB91|nr:pyruvate kinase 1, cytosolic [Selaginella moellendorffii]|eukprot:XP_024545135.1 pyruvate kinase 1, cytosolic [Selaginella moellendorffii]
MQATRVVLQEPLRLAKILDPSEQVGHGNYLSMSKIIGTLGPKSRAVETIEGMLKAGMTVARIDFSYGTPEYHQETMEFLKQAVRNTRTLCGVMMDTLGPELQIINKSETPIAIDVDAFVTLTPDQSKEASSKYLPINFPNLANVVKPKDTIFVGQYLFTGSESTSIWLEVNEVKGNEIVCRAKNAATLAGPLFTALASSVRIDLPTLSENDKKVIASWGKANRIDFLSLSYCRHAEDVKQARALLTSLELTNTQIFAKIENAEGLKHFDDILKEADGIILSRGNLGIDLPSEKVFLFQKAALYKCNMLGKPAVITRVVDTMTENPRPTRAEATDVANAVLDGSDAILLGAETYRGNFPIQSIGTVRRICREAEIVYNQRFYFKKVLEYVGEPMGHLESIASAAVRSATKVGASMIIVFTSAGQAARLIAKYRPLMPVMVVVIPQISTNFMRFSFSGTFTARQCLIVRGLFPILADPQVSTSNAANELVLKMAIEHGKMAGCIKANDRVVVCQKIGDSSVVRIVDMAA